MLKLFDFDYNLPKELIAQYPLLERQAARLLVLNRQKQSLEHRVFKDIVDYLNKGDLIVLNDTKVLPCRLIGKRATGGRVEILLLNKKNGFSFNAMIKPSRLNLQEKIIFNGSETFGTITSKNEITFNVKDIGTIYNLGSMPLPPYIKRDVEDLDKIYYQTVYANKEGAIASPTAGLHFTKKLIEKIKSGGINISNITLHVGIGSFKPVKSDDIKQHKMEPEYFKIPQNSIEAIEKVKNENARIFAVGTTSLRALETYANGIKEGYTDLFVYPAYKFKLADCLLTNFHLPKTTLFMLVCAFAGESFAKKAYQEAIDKKYRFYSYGDAMLII
jgi:S-adenosylmethionine:tRNA ribosyltransferase-isomerase